MPISSAPPLSLRQHRARRLRRIAAELLRDNPFGSIGHTRGRHATYLAVLLEMRVSEHMLAALRQRSKSDLQENAWYDGPDQHEIPTIDVFGDLVLGVDVQDPSEVGAGL
jgi:hypothetical protein